MPLTPTRTWDAATHPLGHGVASFLGEDLVRDMDEIGIDKAIAFPLGAPYTDYSESNATIAAEVEKFPQRIIGFCRINPNFGPQATAKALDHCLGTLKLSGIKLHPEIEFFDPNEEELMEPVYEAARRYRVPVIFHTGMSSKAAPAVIAELASKYPRCSRHFGTHGRVGIRQASRCRCAAERQYLLETSVVGWMPLIMEAFNRVGTSKMLYGSDHPYNPLPMEVEKIARHAARAAKLTEADLRALFSRNILAILNPHRR